MLHQAQADPQRNNALYNGVPLLTADAVRLLKLNSETVNGKQVVSCSLSAVSLKERPHYLALSYAWRSALCKSTTSETQDITYEVMCNGHTIEILENLYHAILRLATPPFEDALFWIDALSIIQWNDEEKSSQVEMMGDIYSGAVKTIVWLGVEDVHFREARHLIAMLGNATQDERSVMRVDMLVHSQENGTSLLGVENTEWLSVVQFFQRSWFSRAWVVQECILARDVMVLCGELELNWQNIVEVSHFFSFAGWSEIYSKLLTKPEHRKSDDATIYQSWRLSGLENPAKLRAILNDLKSGSLNSFLHCLIRVREFDCADLKDKVYCLYAVAEYHGFPMPKPDYLLSTSSVFVQAAIAILSRGDLHILAHVESRCSDGLRLPSWVPDWSCKLRLGLAITGYKRYSAAGNMSQIPLIITEHLILKLDAACIARISISGEVKKDIGFHKTFPGWMSIVERLGDTYFNGQHIFEALWRTLIRDTDERTNCPANDGEYGLQQSFRKWVAGLTPVDSSHCENEMSKPKNLLEYLCLLHLNTQPDLASTLESFCAANSQLREYLQDPLSSSEANAGAFDLAYRYRVHLRLFCTDEGHLGLGCDKLKVDDSIWIVPGSRVPLIMRQKKDSLCSTGDRQYQLVGGAYLHGLMKGEALRPDLDWETISVV